MSKNPLDNDETGNELRGMKDKNLLIVKKLGGGSRYKNHDQVNKYGQNELKRIGYHEVS